MTLTLVAALWAGVTIEPVAAAGEGASSDPVGRASADQLAGLVMDLSPAPRVHQEILPTGESALEIPGETGVLTLPGSADGQVSLADGAVTMTLPGGPEDSGVVVDESLVYGADGADGADGAEFVTVVQGQPGALQVSTVVLDGNGPRSFDYVVDGGEMRLRDDGGVDVVAESDDAGKAAVLATIDSPWAVDAQGEPVGTHYVVDRDHLLQVIDPDVEAAYPIVADPRVSFGRGVYLSFTRSEIQTLSVAAASVLAVGSGAACSVYGSKVKRIPGAGHIVSTLCSKVSAGALYTIVKSLPKAAAKQWTKPCYQTRYPQTNPVWKAVDKNQCGPR